MTRDLSLFYRLSKLSRRRRFALLSWYLIQSIFLQSPLCPSKIRVMFFRFFGGTAGRNVLMRGGIKIHMPWNLVIGDNCWIGESVWFINHEKITLGSNVCISQRTTICSGGHDYRSASLQYSHKPVVIKDGAWVCLDAKVLPGVTIGECSVVSAGEIVRQSLPNYSMLIGGQVREIEPPN